MKEHGLEATGRIAVMVDDMFFAAKILGAARTAGRDIERLRSEQQLEDRPPESLPSMIILDLNSAVLDSVATIASLKSHPSLRLIPIVGFLSHVQVDLKRAAESAGCDWVVPRSLFSNVLHEVMVGNTSSLPQTKR